MRVISIEHIGSRRGRSELVVTVMQQPTWVLRLFGAKPKVSKWRGSCTVWHRVPDAKRAPTWLELRLSDVWTRQQWDYPEQEDASTPTD